MRATSHRGPKTPALRHSGAREISVRLQGDRVVIRDDGDGFQPESPELRARHLGPEPIEFRIRSGHRPTARLLRSP